MGILQAAEQKRIGVLNKENAGDPTVYVHF